MVLSCGGQIIRMEKKKKEEERREGDSVPKSIDDVRSLTGVRWADVAVAKEDIETW